MGTSSGVRISPVWVQRIMIIAIVGALLVLGAYLWGNRLSADTVQANHQAAQYNSLAGVAGVRAADAVQESAAGASYATKVLQHQAGGLAAGSASASPSGSQSSGSRGRTAVHAPGAGP